LTLDPKPCTLHPTSSTPVIGSASNVRQLPRTSRGEGRVGAERRRRGKPYNPEFILTMFPRLRILNG